MATIINLGSAPGESNSPPIVIVDDMEQISVELPPSSDYLSNTLDGLLDVDTAGVEDESLLIYDEDTQTWNVTKNLLSHTIEGGEY